jgi:hypothetical protein
VKLGARMRALGFSGVVVLAGALFVTRATRRDTPAALSSDETATPDAPVATARAAEPGRAPAAPATARVLSNTAPPRAPLPAPPELDEEGLMRFLRSAREGDLGLAVELAREGNRRFPGSPSAPERASILIHALAELGRASEARGEAEDMVNRYPDTDWVREIERFTGAHRHRNYRVDDQGRLYAMDPTPH